MRTVRSPNRNRPCGFGFGLLAVLVLLVWVPSALAGDTYALVVTGAAGAPQYVERYRKWRTAFVQTLVEAFHYPADHVVVLADEEGDGVRRATRDNVRRTLADFARRAGRDDMVFVLLVGHGTSGDGEEAKFNLVGPDLGAREWADLVRPIAARLIFIDTSSASFPFLQRLAARNRIVVTATDSTAQQFETEFPGFFVEAFESAEADLDKNGRVSIWEAFSYASRRVRQWFEERGRLSTERPLLDDTGSGLGREAGASGASDTANPERSLAQVTYLQRDPAIARSGDPAVDDLQKRRSELQAQIEQLRARKSSGVPADYEEQLERLLLELARVERQLREAR